jgi:hypothetical protein
VPTPGTETQRQGRVDLIYGSFHDSNAWSPEVASCSPYIAYALNEAPLGSCLGRPLGAYARSIGSDLMPLPTGGLDVAGALAAVGGEALLYGIDCLLS